VLIVMCLAQLVVMFASTVSKSCNDRVENQQLLKTLRTNFIIGCCRHSGDKLLLGSADFRAIY